MKHIPVACRIKRTFKYLFARYAINLFPGIDEKLLTLQLVTTLTGIANLIQL